MLKSLKIPLILALTLLFVSFSAKSNDSDKKGLGVFASGFATPSIINDDLALFTGFSLGVSFDRNLILRLRFVGLANTIRSAFVDTISADESGIVAKQPVIRMNQIGVDAQYIFGEIGAFEIAGGVFAYYSNFGFEIGSFVYKDGELYSPDYGSRDFFFAEPSVNFILPITDWLRTNFSAGYRMAISGEFQFRDELYDSGNLNGLFASFQFELGSF